MSTAFATSLGFQLSVLISPSQGGGGPTCAQKTLASFGIHLQRQIRQKILSVGLSLTETDIVMPSGKSTSSVTMRWRASAVSGAAEEYRSGLREMITGSFLPVVVATGYWNSKASVG